MSETDTCPFCKDEHRKYGGGLGTDLWNCGTLQVRDGVSSAIRAKDCYEREIAALKAEVKAFAKHRWAAARLICALRAYDCPGIPYSDAHDAFQLLRTIAGDELVEAVWLGAKEPDGKEDKGDE